MGVVSCWMVVEETPCVLDPIYSQLNPAVGILVSAINRDTRYYFLLFNVHVPPRGRPKRRATEPDSPPAVHRHVTATTSPQEEDGVASLWDTGRHANWSVATLLSRIADCLLA